MASDHDDVTEDKGRLIDRRGVLKLAGFSVFASAGLAGVLSGDADAQSAAVTSADSEVHVSPGEYTWNGGFDISSGGAIVGDGEPGDVVYNLESGTMDGDVRGRLENIVIRGENPEPKAGLNIYPGGEINGVVWPEGGNQAEDRAVYTPDGGSEHAVVRNSAFAWMKNNGMYVDKPPMRIENCAAVNNNITNMRVGHRDGSSESDTTYIRNSLIAVTDRVRPNENGDRNARGLRIRHAGNFVIENCYFLYLDVDGAGALVEVEDDAAGASVELRNCTFYNESGRPIVKDDSGGSVDITVENCVAAGGGNYDTQSVGNPGLQTTNDVTIPSPGALTGYSAANEIEGVGPGVGPWTESDFGDGATAPEPTPTPDEPTDPSHTLVLHASPDNSQNVDVSFTVDGTIEFADESEPGTDRIVDNGDGTATATSVSLNPDALDSYSYSGQVVDYTLPDSGSVDVAVDGTVTSFEELTGQTDSSDGSTDDGSTDGSGSDGGDGSTDGGSGGDGSTGGNDAAKRKVIVVDGSSTPSVAEYTFTVTGDVARDAERSSSADSVSGWDQLEDIAKDGKVIGIVGSGVDAYRYSGKLQDLTVQGDADVSFERVKP
mgnify:CR=1 FL=1